MKTTDMKIKHFMKVKTETNDTVAVKTLKMITV